MVIVGDADWVNKSKYPKELGGGSVIGFNFRVVNKSTNAELYCYKFKK